LNQLTDDQQEEPQTDEIQVGGLVNTEEAEIVATAAAAGTSSTLTVGILTTWLASLPFPASTLLQLVPFC
jgi:hypothetical protein